MQSFYLRGNQTEIVENNCDKCRRVHPVLFRCFFYAPSFASVQRMFLNTNAYTIIVEKCKRRDCIGAVIAAGRLRSAPRLSFECKARSARRICKQC